MRLNSWFDAIGQDCLASRLCRDRGGRPVPPKPPLRFYRRSTTRARRPSGASRRREGDEPGGMSGRGPRSRAVPVLPATRDPGDLRRPCRCRSRRRSPSCEERSARSAWLDRALAARSGLGRGDDRCRSGLRDRSRDDTASSTRRCSPTRRGHHRHLQRRREQRSWPNASRPGSTCASGGRSGRRGACVVVEPARRALVVGRSRAAGPRRSRTASRSRGSSRRRSSCRCRRRPS